MIQRGGERIGHGAARRGRRGVAWLALLALPWLSGCGALLAEGASAGAGIGGAALADAVGAGPRTTTGIGIGAQAGARAALQYAQRRAHLAAQTTIARAAGPLAVGQVAPWSIRHSAPIEPDEGGEVTVARAFGAGAVSCKEIVFSVDGTGEDRRRAFYTAHICRDGQAWRWASAEPATERWGSLQ
jgi:hypothetical protein